MTKSDSYCFSQYMMSLNLLAKTIFIEFKFRLYDITLKKLHTHTRARERAHAHTTKYLCCYKSTNVLTINISNITQFLEVVFPSGHRVVADSHAITVPLFVSMHNAKKIYSTVEKRNISTH
jgi:hypothetical protein